MPRLVNVDVLSSYLAEGEAFGVYSAMRVYSRDAGRYIHTNTQITSRFIFGIVENGWKKKS